MSSSIRPAVSDDWATIRGLRLAALAESPLAFAATLKREEQFGEQTWRARAEAGSSFLAWSGDAVVGTATAYADPAADAGTLSLVAMYVAPEARGTGCAFRLIDAVVAAATARGANRLLLHVTEVNPVAQRCYYRYGFRDTGRRLALPHRPEIAEIEMVLPLG